MKNSAIAFIIIGLFLTISNAFTFFTKEIVADFGKKEIKHYKPHYLIWSLLIGTALIGVDGIFCETHPDPASAKSDGANMLKLDLLEDLLTKLISIRQTINKFH